jgi:MFS family permease
VLYWHRKQNFWFGLGLGDHASTAQARTCAHQFLNSGFFTVLSALRGRDFRLFWVGAFVSNIGSWIQSIALSWLVLQLTNSPFALGIVNFASTVPILALSLLGGVFVDRADRRRWLQVTQSLLLILAAILAAVTYLGQVRIEHIIAIALLTGIVTAANSPAWQAFIVDLVEPSDLPTAIALNSTQFNLSRVLGPSIAGVLLAIIGAAGCFFVNSLSYVAVVGALFFIHPRRIVRRQEAGSIWQRLGVGLTYVAGHPVLRPLVLQTSVMTVFGFPYALLMPVMAQQVLGLGASGYGAMMSATGIGAICGSLSVAAFGRRFPRGRLLVAAELGFSASVVGFSASRSFPIALALLGCLGFGMIVYMTNANTTLQLTTPDELRGRVMSIWTLVSFGMAPLGSLIAGAIAERWGAPTALGFGGLVCALAGVTTAFLSPALRALPAAAAPALPVRSPAAPATR